MDPLADSAAMVWVERGRQKADGYDKVAEFGEYGYEWKITTIWRHDGRLFADTQSGCSCNEWEPPLVGDLVELPDLAAVERYWQETVADGWYDLPKWFNVRDEIHALGLR